MCHGMFLWCDNVECIHILLISSFLISKHITVLKFIMVFDSHIFKSKYNMQKDQMCVVLFQETCVFFLMAQLKICFVNIDREFTVNQIIPYWVR